MFFFRFNTHSIQKFNNSNIIKLVKSEIKYSKNKKKNQNSEIIYSKLLILRT